MWLVLLWAPMAGYHVLASSLFFMTASQVREGTLWLPLIQKEFSGYCGRYRGPDIGALWVFFCGHLALLLIHDIRLRAIYVVYILIGVYILEIRAVLCNGVGFCCNPGDFTFRFNSLSR